MILPYSSFRLWWDLVCLFGLIYNSIVVPFMAVKVVDPNLSEEDIRSFTLGVLLDYLVDFFFIIDIYMHLNRFAYTEFGIVVTSLAKIRSKYLRTWFWLDFFSTIPADLVLWFINPKLVPIIRLTRMLRCIKLFTYFKVIEAAFEERNNSRLNTGLIRVGKQLFFLCLTFFWLGCIWVLVAFIQYDESRSWIFRDWIKDSNYGSRVLRSFYFVIASMTTIGC